MSKNKVRVLVNYIDIDPADRYYDIQLWEVTDAAWHMLEFLLAEEDSLISRFKDSYLIMVF